MILLYIYDGMLISFFWDRGRGRKPTCSWCVVRTCEYIAISESMSGQLAVQFDD